MKTLLLIALSTLTQVNTDSTETPVSAGPSPAEQKIERALDAIGAQPDDARRYNQLAWAFSKRARETADTEFYQRGEQALVVSEALQPGNLGAQKARVWLLLGQHRFREALELAGELNRKVPDDVLVYGFLVDGYVELGKYAAAEEACQWMLDLRPGNIAGITRAAYLRELFGDVDGALELMGEAFHAVHPDETEERAWILTHMALLHRSVGRIEVAAPLLERALNLFPGYHYALAQLAHVNRDAGNGERAIELLRERYSSAPHPENLFDLALALDEEGQVEEAATLYLEFEAAALGESESLDNANRSLIRYWTDHAEERASDALALAEREAERRRDVHTLDALAWALHANGDSGQALHVIKEALAVGVRDARMLLHAGTIAKSAGQFDQAREWLSDVAGLEPASDAARDARRLLEELTSEA